MDCCERRGRRSPDYFDEKVELGVFLKQRSKCDRDILPKFRGNKYRSHADKFAPPPQFAKQNLGNLITNVRLFLINDFLIDSGMKYVMESFYTSIREGALVTILNGGILLTIRIMGEISDQLVTKRSQDQFAYQVAQFQGE